MSAALQHASDARIARLSALVSQAEASEITRRAAAEGLSVSAFLRQRALMPSPKIDSEAVERMDAVIDGLHERVDLAIEAVRATLDRLRPP